MLVKNINLGLTAADVRRLDKLAKKLGLDRTNTIRYAIAKAAELENIK